MQAIKKYQLTENRIGILIIIGTIIIYHFIVFETEIMAVMSKYVSNSFFIGMIIPGLIAATIYAIFTQKLIRIIGICVLTIIIWYVWFVIYISRTFTIR